MLQITHEGVASARAPDARGKLKILQIVPTYYPAVRYGGPIRSVHTLATSLVGRGHDVQVYTSSMDGPNDLRVPLGAPVDIDGVRVHYFAVRRLRRLCWCPALAAALRRSIGNFDIVHLHSIFLWPTWAAARIAKRAGVPYLLSPRGMLGTEVIRRKNKLVKSAWIHVIEKRTIKDAAALHVTAEIEREEIAALGLRTATIHCIPNGVKWPANHQGIAAGPLSDISEPYALFLSRIDAKKGLDRLIAAWKLVPGLSLVIAGNDESGYQKKLEQLAAEAGVRNRIRFTGAVPDEHKWALYENAMMFILPSYSENFGNVVAEAMAMGCPVIVTPEVGVASLVRESGAGVVVDGAPETLAGAIRTLLLQDTTHHRAMGDRGRLAVRRQLSWESAAARMEALYEGLKGGGAAIGPTV